MEHQHTNTNTGTNTNANMSSRNNGGSARFCHLDYLWLLIAAAWMTDYNSVLSFTVQSSPTPSTRYYKSTYVNVKFKRLKSRRSSKSKHKPLFEFESENETSPFGAGELCNTPLEAPTTFPYKEDKFYIRECYPEYYDLLMELFKDKQRKYDCITVTGTPGIGKSIFYLYFLMRYRRENPGKSVVTASFTNDRELKKCVLYQHDGKIIEKVVGDDPKLPHPQNLDGLDCEFFLYDGPPKVSPDGVKTISFSSPNVGWLNAMAKNKHHLEIYMPLWTLEELQDANKLLALNIKKEELDKRFEAFGGSARYCLTTDPIFVNKGLRRINEAVATLKIFSDVRRLFEGIHENANIFHRLMNYIPDKQRKTMFSLQPASWGIKEKLRKQLLLILSENRTGLMVTLEGSIPGSAFAGFLFESFAHDTLAAGGIFNIDSLETDGGTRVVEMNGQHAQFKSDFTRDETQANVYCVPKSPNYASIDSFVLKQDGHLMLFQMTRSMRHPIKASGLIHTMTRLQVLDDIRHNPELATLIFVIPTKTRVGFTKQEITDMDTLSWEDVQGRDVTEVPGVGPATKQKLNNADIKTIGELKVAMDANRLDDVLKPRKKSIENSFQLYLDGLNSNFEFLKIIPQFVLELDYSTITEIAMATTTTTAESAPP